MSLQADYCPECNSNMISCDPVTIEDNQAYQDCSCDECTAEWTLVFKLADIRVSVEGVTD